MTLSARAASSAVGSAAAAVLSLSGLPRAEADTEPTPENIRWTDALISVPLDLSICMSAARRALYSTSSNDSSSSKTSPKVFFKKATCSERLLPRRFSAYPALRTIRCRSSSASGSPILSRCATILSVLVCQASLDSRSGSNSLSRTARNAAGEPSSDDASLLLSGVLMPAPAGATARVVSTGTNAPEDTEPPAPKAGGSTAPTAPKPRDVPSPSSSASQAACAASAWRSASSCRQSSPWTCSMIARHSAASWADVVLTPSPLRRAGLPPAAARHETHPR